MELNLSERLKLIAQFVQPGDVVADIGTDHGYLPIWLIQNKIINKAIITDINEGPLEKAASNINKYLGTADIDLRRGNGLEVLHVGESDTTVIAGMGGILIKKILTASPEVAKSNKAIILQPRRDAALLRKYLINESEFKIVEERVAREKDRYSEIIVATSSENSVTENVRSRWMLAEALAEQSGLPDDLFYEFPKLYLCGNQSVADMIKFRLSGAFMIKDSIINKASTPESKTKLKKIENRIEQLKTFLAVGIWQ